MKFMKIFILITIALFYSCYTLSAQEKTISKNKIYKTWISLESMPEKVSGILYEVRDSSILLSHSIPIKNYSTSHEYISEFYFNEIHLLKTRKIDNVKKGALIGSISGFALGTIYGAIASGALYEANPISFLNPLLISGTILISGTYLAVIGAGIGALSGTIKDRFPIKGSYENFNSYRGVFQNYSYMQEYTYYANFFEHRGFLGFFSGPSFPLVDFAIPQEEGDIGVKKIGGGGSITFGYRFKENIGISISNFYNFYPAENNETSTHWTVGGYIISPMFSIPVKNKLFIDLKPGVGFADTDLVVDNEFTKPGFGLGINLCASVQYNFSKRWCLMTDPRYLYTNQKHGGSDKGTFQTFSLDFGLAYRFSKTSL